MEKLENYIDYRNKGNFVNSQQSHFANVDTLLTPLDLINISILKIVNIVNKVFTKNV